MAEGNRANSRGGVQVGRPPVSPYRRANLYWKQLVQGRAIMFGEGFEDCWYKVPGVPGLDLSGDLRFRGSKGYGRLATTPREAICNGPDGYPDEVLTERSGQGRRVMLHRAVMSVPVRPGVDARRDRLPQGRRPGETTGRRTSISAITKATRLIACGTVGHVRGDSHPCTRILDAQVREIRLALSRGKRARDLASVYGVHKSTISRIKHGVRRQSC